jgi:non-ribosomal peptide synthetase component F
VTQLTATGFDIYLALLETAASTRVWSDKNLSETGFGDISKKDALLNSRSVCPFPDCVYVVQTSGTTGSRKYVFVSDRSIAANVADFSRAFPLAAAETIFAAAPPTFDPSYVDLFLWLTMRCRLVFVPASAKIRSRTLADILFRRQRVSYFQGPML